MSNPGTPSAATTPAPGVQILLDAEKEANRQVQEARQYRVQRIKDARAEAQQEIESLKKSHHESYLAYEKEILGSLDAEVAKYAEETVKKIEEVKKTGEEKSPEIVKLLLETVVKVDAKIHPNASLRLCESQN